MQRSYLREHMSGKEGRKKEGKKYTARTYENEERET
jgi:hypothetical protein